MSNIVMICALVMLVSHVSSAVILRPKWYPYFRRENQGSSDSGSSSSQSDTMTRQARALEMDTFPVCHDGMVNEECLEKIVQVISRILQLNSQKYPMY